MTDGYHVERQGDVLRIRVASSADALSMLRRFETECTDFEFRHGTMDDVFLSLIGPSIARGAES
ncbi:MAG: hypothetical protein ACR2OU_11125 [Thermomicrobiales bacterium]